MKVTELIKRGGPIKMRLHKENLFSKVTTLRDQQLALEEITMAPNRELKQQLHNMVVPKEAMLPEETQMLKEPLKNLDLNLLPEVPEGSLECKDSLKSSMMIILATST